MLQDAEVNLKHYKIKNYTLKKADATKMKEHWDYVAADLPYARNTKKQDLGVLYDSFLKNLKRNLRKKAVIGFPDFVNYKKYIKKNKLKIEL